jgi:hypothetical protein
MAPVLEMPYGNGHVHRAYIERPGAHELPASVPY